jgi:hypothetical protein
MEFGTRFAKWGLGLFIFGVFLTFAIIAHYCAGARWPTGDLFKANITLWWACPWTLSVAAVQAGGLGMVALGLTRLLAARLSPRDIPQPAELRALWLCIIGLLGVFAVGYPGYFVYDAIWPSFFYSPIATGKNVWLLSQAFFIAVYFAGAVMMFNAVRRALNAVAPAAQRSRSASWATTSAVVAGVAGVLLSTNTPPVQAEIVDTRLGKLDLQAGYPSKATADRLFDEMDFQRATQAFIWALPTVGFHGLHLAHRNVFGAKDGEVVLYQTLKDKAGMLTPNLTTLYLMSFWNLAEQGPMVVEVPAGATAGGFLDVWQRPITDTGQTGPDRGGGGKYLIVPPGSDIQEMRGYIVGRSPSNQVWFAVRDPQAAEETARKHKVYAWAQRDNPPATKFIPVGGKDWASAQPVNLDYWRYLSEVIQPEPVEARDKVMMGMLVPLGIEKGKLFSPNERQRKILTEAAQVGELMARTNAFDKRYANAAVWPDKRWEYANMVELDQNNNYTTQVDERGSWYYEAIGNTVGMQGRTLNFGQVYLETSKDKNGDWLDGGKTYRITVPANPPVVQFWSLTLYDNVTRGPVVTDQGAADMSSRQSLVANADGSVDLYFGPTKPAQAQNWVKTIPGRGWFPYFRLYGPKEAYFDKSWQLDDIELQPEGTGGRALQ